MNKTQMWLFIFWLLLCRPRSYTDVYMAEFAYG